MCYCNPQNSATVIRGAVFGYASEPQTEVSLYDITVIDLFYSKHIYWSDLFATLTKQIIW